MPWLSFAFLIPVPCCSAGPQFFPGHTFLNLLNNLRCNLFRTAFFGGPRNNGIPKNCHRPFVHGVCGSSFIRPDGRCFLQKEAPGQTMMVIVTAGPAEFQTVHPDPPAWKGGRSALPACCAGHLRQTHWRLMQS